LHEEQSQAGILRRVASVLLRRLELAKAARAPQQGTATTISNSRWNPVGLYFTAYEIYNDNVFDLITKKKISANAAAYPDGKKRAETGLVLPGLQVVSISSEREFEDALTLCILNGKIKYKSFVVGSHFFRQGELKSHMFFRLSIKFQKPAEDKNKASVKSGIASPPRAAFASPLVKKVLAEPSRSTPLKASKAEVLVDKHVNLDFALLAPFTSTSRGFKKLP
jgi:hypothetical protein